MATELNAEKSEATSPRKLSPTWLTIGAIGIVLLGLLFISLNLAQNRNAATTSYGTSIDVNDEAALTQETLRISDELECPICEGQSVAYSNSMLATEMKAEVRRQLEGGATEAEIQRYFVDRYGEVVLREPPRTGFNQVLWLMPFIAIGAGALMLIVMLLRTNRNRRATQAAGNQSAGNQAAATSDVAGVDQEIEELLSGYDKELFSSK